MSSRPSERRTNVSVAMCTYNGAAFVEEQLESIAGQRRPPDELVVCDDGSTDGTQAILEDFRDEAPFPVRIVRNEVRRGVVGNFEEAVRRTEGEVVFLADQDDAWDPAKVGTLLKRLEADRKAGFVFCDARLVDREGEDLGELLSSRYRLPPDYGREFAARNDVSQLALLLRANHAVGTTLAFRSELEPLLLPFSPVWGHDQWITHLAAASARYGIRHPEPLQDYRLHPGQDSGAPAYPGLSVRAGRHVEERSLPIDHPARYIQRLVALRERILERRAVAAESPRAVGIIENRLAYHLGDLRHTLRRNGIRAGRPGAARALLGELAAGRYREHSSGLASVATDILWWLRSRLSATPV